MKSTVIIRVNASVDSVVVNGQVFDRTSMTKDEKGLVRRMIKRWRFPQKEAA